MTPCFNRESKLILRRYCLFNAAELLFANGTLLWPIHCMFILQSVGQDKYFIEYFLKMLFPNMNLVTF